MFYVLKNWLPFAVPYVVMVLYSWLFNVGVTISFMFVCEQLTPCLQTLKENSKVCHT